MSRTKKPRPIRDNVPANVRQLVLHESGYKCGNPNCPNMVTLEFHHVDALADDGPDTPSNLLTLCAICHGRHHRTNEIPKTSIRAWKMLLLALNEAYDKRSIQILLMLPKLSSLRVSGDGLAAYAPLIAGGLVDASPYFGQSIVETHYSIALSDRGRVFLDGWKAGDQVLALTGLTRPPAAEA